MTGATFFRTVGCRPSGPAALDGFSPASNLRTPLSVTWMLGILANLRFKSSEEKFGQNCWFKLLALSKSDSARRSCWVWSGGID